MNDQRTGTEINRRSFLRSTAAAGAGLAFSPFLAQSGAAGADTINIALLGAGAQGQVLMNACRNIPGVRFKAVCDIWTGYNQKRVSRMLKAYRHDLTDYKKNATGHLKAILSGHSVTLPLTGGRLDLGTYQTVYYFEFDGQREKEVLVKIVGE